MTPSLEVNGKTYQFTASMKLKQMYDKDVQNLVLRNLANAEENYKIEDVNQLNEFIEQIKNEQIKEEDILASEEMQLKMAKFLDILSNMDSFPTNYEYCFKMLNESEKMKRDQFEQFVLDMAEEYGEENISLIINGICEKVFTKTAEKKIAKKSLPDWITKR